MQNRAQPFLKVTLPPGATMVSVDVAGQPAKPVLGTDGTRVPLLRPGFRPSGPYQVSFVYLHAGTPFAKKGDIADDAAEDGHAGRHRRMGGVRARALFHADDRRQRHRRQRAGSAGEQHVDVLRSRCRRRCRAASSAGLPAAPPGRATARDASASPPASRTGAAVTGRAVDESGAVLPGVTIEVATMAGVRTVVTDGNGAFTVSDVLPGPVTVMATLSGFSISAIVIQRR